MIADNLQFSWPQTAGLEIDDDAIVGCYSPDPISIGHEPNEKFDTFTAPGVFLAASRAGVYGNRAPIHSNEDLTLAFRGYVLEPAIHAYSDSSLVLEEFRNRWDQGRNGVFSCMIYDRRSHRFGLLADTLGFGPVYYRNVGRVCLFATNPRYLSLAGDKPDMLAWLSVLHCGSIVGERTLTKDVHRLRAGSVLLLEQGQCLETTLDSFISLPSGELPAGDTAVGDVETVFQESMDRLLNIGDQALFLPLSSGHDSRRILASLMDRQVPFTAHTAKVHQKEYRNLDAVYASEMAAHFGFEHEVIEPRNSEDYAADDRRRRVLTDCECSAHSWAMALMDRLPAHPTQILDGVLGDILGNPGFRMPGMYEDNRSDRDLIVDSLTTNAFDNWLNPEVWPDKAELREELHSFVSRFLDRSNMAEFVFILLRQRRMISPWSQQLAPPGHLVSCPFVDLEYLKLLLSYRPADKHRMVFQRSCLQAFWPDYFRFPGNRDIPEDLAPGDPTVDESREFACYRQLQSEVSPQRKQMRSLLTTKGIFRSVASRASKKIWRSSKWLDMPLLELSARQSQHGQCWTNLKTPG